MKWKSLIISEASGALGKEIVFSRWKGRNYMRKLVKPANPRTPRQVALRDAWSKIVQLYQARGSAAREAWNRKGSKMAMPISGFNLFVSEGRRSWIRAQVQGSESPQVKVSYHVGFSLGDARIYRYCLEDDAWEDVTPSSLDKDGEFVDNGVEQGKTYTYFLADGSVLKDGDSPPQPYQVVTSYYPDVENGVALEATVSL